MSVNNKLIDIEKLSRYHENLKGVLETKEAAGEAAKAESAAKKYVDEEIAKLSFDEAGAAAQALEAAKEFATGLVVDGENPRFDAAGVAAQALADAKVYTNDEIAKLSFDEAGTAAGLNAAMDERVAKLEAIDHEKLATDASAAAVATVLDGAPEAFNTLKEVAEWIGNNDHATDVATLMTDVANLKAIDHEAYKGADDDVLQDAKDYADDKFQVKGNYEEAGAAAQALADAKADAANLYQVKGEYLTANDFEFATDGDIDGLFA